MRSSTGKLSLSGTPRDLGDSCFTGLSARTSLTPSPIHLRLSGFCHAARARFDQLGMGLAATPT